MRLRSFPVLGLLAIAAAMTLVIAACGEGEPDDDPAPTPTPAPNGDPGDPNGDDPTPTPPDDDFDAEEYFGGQTIRLMTSSNPGGGTDVQMRVIATHLSNYIPGNPRVVASNVPPHVVGKNFIYNADPDGLTHGLYSTSMLREEHFPDAEYDSAALTYIADVGEDANVVLVRDDGRDDDVPYQTLEDAMGGDVPLVTMSDAPEPAGIESLLLGQMMIADFLDIPFEVVQTAERGTGPAILALERGDINSYQFGGGAWGLLPADRPGWLTDGFLRPLYNMTMSGSDPFPNEEMSELPDHVDHVFDHFTEEQREMFIGMSEAPRNMNRPLVMPPDVPEEVASAVIDAYHDMFHDDAFCDDWERITGAPCRVWTEGQEVQERAAEGQAAMNEWADEYDTFAEEYFERFVR